MPTSDKNYKEYFNSEFIGYYYGFADNSEFGINIATDKPASMIVQVTFLYDGGRKASSNKFFLFSNTVTNEASDRFTNVKPDWANDTDWYLQERSVARDLEQNVNLENEHSEYSSHVSSQLNNMDNTNPNLDLLEYSCILQYLSSYAKVDYYVLNDCDKDGNLELLTLCALPSNPKYYFFIADDEIISFNSDLSANGGASFVYYENIDRILLEGSRESVGYGATYLDGWDGTKWRAIKQYRYENNLDKNKEWYTTVVEDFWDGEWVFGKTEYNEDDGIPLHKLPTPELFNIQYEGNSRELINTVENYLKKNSRYLDKARGDINGDSIEDTVIVIADIFKTTWESLHVENSFGDDGNVFEDMRNDHRNYAVVILSTPSGIQMSPVSINFVNNEAIFNDINIEDGGINIKYDNETLIYRYIEKDFLATPSIELVDYLYR